MTSKWTPIAPHVYVTERVRRIAQALGCKLPEPSAELEEAAAFAVSVVEDPRMPGECDAE